MEASNSVQEPVSNQSDQQLVQQVSKRKGFILPALGALLVVAFIGVGAYYLGSKQAFQRASSLANPVIPANSHPQQSSFTKQGNAIPNQSQVEQLVNTVFERVKNETGSLIGLPQISRGGSAWWVSDDNWSILVPTKSSLIAKIRPINEYTRNEAEAQKLQSIVKDVMVVSGFKTNTINSSKSENDTTFYDYVAAYELYGTRCVATTSPDVVRGANETEFYSAFVFDCFDDNQFQSAYNAQIPFLKALNDRTAIVRDIKVNGDKATMSVGWRRTGAAAFMYKSGDEWKVIDVGNGFPQCSELKNNNVPQQYWTDCIDSSNNIQKGSF